MAAQPQAQRKATPKQPAKHVKILQSLRNIQTEQALKLQQKYQFEQDLLEDIRAYAKQRSAVEKDYAQALQKLNSQFIQKRDFSSEEGTGNNEHRTPISVWKAVLDESEKISKQRMEMSEALQTQIADNIKTVKANKAHVFKKCQELIQKIHEELFETVREMSKAKKGYMEFEKLAQVAREQAAEAEDKYKKKNVKFFQSKATLEKNVSKSSSRKEVSEKRATVARNEYLLSLAASNAHMMRYYCADLQQIMNNVYGDFYEKVRDYFTSISKLDVDASSSAKSGFESVGSQAEMIDRDYCVECFLTKSKVFTEVIRYDFDPWRHDKVKKLSTVKNAGLALNKEARKLAMRLAREQHTLREKQKALSALTCKSVNSDEALVPGDGNQDNEQSPEMLRDEIRQSEIVKLKTEACLDLLREAGVNVEEWMKSANSLSAADADTGFGGSQNSLNSGTTDGPEGWDEEWDMDDTFTGGYSSDEDANSITSTGSLPAPCVALYNFDATTVEELSIAENEELEVLERDGKGWCKGRNKTGQTGFFPETYIELRIKDRASSVSTHSSSGHSGSYTEGSVGGSPVIKSDSRQDIAYLCLVKALYDYEAMSEEEISFNEGDIIQVTKKDDNGVDDGFWEGHISGQHGVFPCLVVEEIGGSSPSSSTANEPKSTPNNEEQPYNDLAPANTNTTSQRAGEYIELPKDYVPGVSLQPTRRAPPPPKGSPKPTKRRDSGGSANMDPMDRQRAQTENVTTMRKPDDGSSYARSVSYEYPPASKQDYENINAFPSGASNTADYVNACELPRAGSSNGATAKPPKPPPPTAKSRRAYQSKSYV